MRMAVIIAMILAPSYALQASYARLKSTDFLVKYPKEWELKAEDIAREHGRETRALKSKIQDLSAQLAKLADRNTLLSAENIIYTHSLGKSDSRPQAAFTYCSSAGLPALPAPPFSSTSGTGQIGKDAIQDVCGATSWLSQHPHPF